MGYHISLDLGDEDLEKISRDMQLSLSLGEMKTIKAHYSKIGRDATNIELETFAQTWSEHCCHKTFRGDIELDGRVISDLLKSTIAKVTNDLNMEWCF
jgi:phosphoribosylformylglycinamidine synthase